MKYRINYSHNIDTGKTDLLLATTKYIEKDTDLFDTLNRQREACEYFDSIDKAISKYIEYDSRLDKQVSIFTKMVEPGQSAFKKYHCIDYFCILATGEKTLELYSIDFDVMPVPVFRSDSGFIIVKKYSTDLYAAVNAYRNAFSRVFK